MKFATIIREAGFAEKHFKKCAEIPTILYDGKNRIDSSEDVRYVENLFAHNPNSFMNFYTFLTVLEENIPDSINVKIDEATVIVFYKTENAKIFFRKNSPMEPMDYMD